MSKLPEWEEIFFQKVLGGVRKTERLKVFGGWMVCYIIFDDVKKLHTQSSIFVPDPNHEWVLE